ncbi:hypothetical protein [Azotobacter vinelandii]|uniref:hypothetical protein n=1 Tax=Azotobacter vinelandii TaxID=354 RepID=UPI00077411F1|nr:hypothetical protein [Azotobacter vinelandii]
MSELILYSTEDGRSQIKLRAKDQTIWLSQREMAELFDVSTDNVSLQLKNIFEDGELDLEETTEESSVVQTEGASKCNHAQMERATTALYLDYDQHRKQDEARQADVQDDAELKVLENTLKKRPKP